MSGASIHQEVIAEVEGAAVTRFTLRTGSGACVRILNFGGIVQAVEIPDRVGRLSNVVLGFSTFEEYRRFNPARNPRNPDGVGVYFGALIGRYANPLGDGQFPLDGRIIRVPKNTPGHALHGGTIGFDQKVWEAEGFQSAAGCGVHLRYTSPDGEMGFPGDLEVEAIYRLEDPGRLVLEFEAATDAPTVVNLTNHIYWNLSGEGSGSSRDHRLYINADSYIPVDRREVPTGEIRPVEGTAFDFRTPTAIGERTGAPDEQLEIARGYDHNWVLNQTHPASLIEAARVHEPVTGRTLTLLTTQPGLQFYAGNFLDGTLVGSGGRPYQTGDGFALEAQHYPDAPNHSNFPSTRLNPGDSYHQIIVFEFGVS